MAGQDAAVCGIYPTHASEEYGVAALRNDGFRNSDLSLLYPETTESKDFAQKKVTKPKEGRSDSKPAVPPSDVEIPKVG